LTPVDKCGGAPAAEQPPSALASLIGDADPPLWIHVRSERPWCARALAHELAARAQRPVLEVSTDGLEASGAPNTPQGQIRDALLYNAILLVWLAENADPGGSKERAPAWATLCENDALTVVWYGSPRVSLPLPQDVDIAVHTLNIPVPDYDARLQLWYSAARDLPLSGDADLPALAARYRLDGDQIARAARAAFERARQRYAATPQIGFDDLASASREVSAVRLGDLANQIVPRHTWQDLVLPSDRTAQIREMCDQFRFRHVVYGTWGMGRRSARGQGLSALFAGPSGTGKTMAAEVIAHDLALDLYKIDLSGVVSKYIGETEKNLDRIFDLARDSNAILLFDEADALFGKRSETKDAHDRYANIEISYLLQKVEEYDGVVILTSNLRQNLDEAFMRRLQFSIEFPFPDEAARREIWERTVPPEMPLADDVDWDHLAMRFRLSGGGIRNALVSAAFLAARDGSAVAMRHLLWGVRREFQKLGKLVDEEEFVPAFSGHDLRGAHDGSGGR